MKVYTAKGSGFCFGVKRAIGMAYKCAMAEKKGSVYSFHEIIHNPQEVKRLEDAGAKHVDDTAGLKPGSTVIVSTHGITPAEEAGLRAGGLCELDTTCPYVKKIHQIVKRLAAEDYDVVIAGDRKHLEVKGILGHAGGRGTVVTDAADIKRLKLGKKTGVVSQTTLNKEVYMKLAAGIMEKAFSAMQAEVRVFHTICGATQERQEATARLAGKVDVMIIIGGKNSANTKRLYQISRKILKDVHHIESGKELTRAWFRGKKAAGVSGGASTPENVIRDIVKKIRKIGEN
jgi:4-hydroxy-3-methylbut-2-enyl diphosphate reductase